MVEPLNLQAVRLLMCAGFLAGNCLSIAAAENFQDPTRPPSTFAAPGSAVAETADVPVLQSVLISPNRKVAVISGKTLQVGDHVGDARVSRITETEVVMVQGGRAQTLKLFPGIEKRRTPSGATAKVHNRQQ